MVLNLNKLESPSPTHALCQVWLKMIQQFWRRRFFNFLNVFLLFHYHLLLENWGPFIRTNLNPLQPRMAQWFWRRRFSNFVNIFSLFHNYLLFEKVGALHLTKHKSPSPKNELSKFGWYWPSGYGEEDF